MYATAILKKKTVFLEKGNYCPILKTLLSKIYVKLFVHELSNFCKKLFFQWFISPTLYSKVLHVLC